MGIVHLGTDITSDILAQEMNSLGAQAHPSDP